MSLRVWLPLNGTLDNQGLDDVVVTNNGATVDNSGKIGKCYSFDGNSSGININGNIISTLAQGDFSICFWVYNDDQGNCSIYIATIPSSSYAFAIQKTTGEGLRVYWQSSPDYYPTNFTIPIQEWCHIAVVIKNNNCYCYKNGILITSREDGSFTPQKLTNTWLYGVLGRDLRTGATVLKGKMNDFRWYDHALSPMEVKQISQGLILHYLLNAKNLFNYHATTYAKSFAPSGNIQNTTGWAISDYIPIFPNQSYLGIGLSAGGSNTYAVLYDVNKNKTRTILEVANQNLIVNSNQNEYYIRLSIRDFNHELTTTAKFLENNDIQYDTSGYCNNGIKVGTFDYDNDTPKYNVSTKIAASATGIKLTNFSIGNIWSMSVWFKYPSQDNTGWKALVILNNSGSDSDLQFGNYINCNDGRIQYSANGKYNSSSVHLIFGEWNHLVSTYDGTTLRCYFNGEYKASLTPGQTLSNKSNLGVGFKSNAVDFSTFGASMTNGLLSDVRVYTTALSADDVKSLYQNSAYIDNQGNIYGAIYEEV